MSRSAHDWSTGLIPPFIFLQSFCTRHLKPLTARNYWHPNRSIHFLGIHQESRDTVQRQQGTFRPDLWPKFPAKPNVSGGFKHIRTPSVRITKSNNRDETYIYDISNMNNAGGGNERVPLKGGCTGARTASNLSDRACRRGASWPWLRFGVQGLGFRGAEF